MKILRIATILVGITCLGFAFAAKVHAAGTIVINNIEMTNFMPTDTLKARDEIYPVENTPAFAIEFAPDITKFQITILQGPYDANRQKAENEFVQKLHITRNEACFLDVRVVAPAYVEQDAQVNEKLSFCSSQKLADANGDGVVNTFDYAICLDELANPPSDFKMACDFNVNRRIDATDLSQIITYYVKTLNDTQK